MFTILSKNFAGRKTDRYFKDWVTAKEELDKDVEDCCKSLGGKVIRAIDRFNREKGWYEYEKTASFPNNESCTWALIDGYFEDDF